VGYDFDEVIDRRGTLSAKWDGMGAQYGREDAIPLWVADMDFRSPAAVLRALEARLAHGVFGYTHVPEEFYEAVIGWLHRRHGWRVERDWIVPGTGVVSGLAVSVRAFTRPGEGVVIQPPVYHPFRKTVEQNGRRTVENPLRLEQGRLTPDLDHLESCFREGARLLLLCSPHNPGGRAWSEEELRGMLACAHRYGVVVVSDEIHFDLLMAGTRHVPTARLAEGGRVVTLTAPTKTFNFPALRAAYTVIADAELRKLFEAEQRTTAAMVMSLPAVVATIAAYNEGEPWLDALLPYLAGNLDLLRRELTDMGLRLVVPEATYLAWVDCREMGLDDRQLMDFFVGKAGLAPSPGVQFGAQGSGFMRLNFACPRSVLARAMEQLRRALGERMPSRRGKM
jgi:cystathionine beta-lyase